MSEMIHFSFTLTYVLLLTTGTITLVEALKTNNPFVRHVMNLETCISIVAGYFYGKFLEKIKRKTCDWKSIEKTRYIDWCITTPIMLLVLCTVLGMHTKRRLHLMTYLVIVSLNYIMLYIGYMGETNKIDKFHAMILGFIPFVLMFGIIYYQFVLPKYVYANYALFSVYLIVWSTYGIVYLLDNVSKNITFNTLDLISKCFIGLGLWVYYTKIIT
jgi:bacteriorhodopsin